NRSFLEIEIYQIKPDKDVRHSFQALWRLTTKVFRRLQWREACSARRVTEANVAKPERELRSKLEA
ncbi:hypothetical protein, partial [Leptospira licerasiae]|uniref:hypothetical protein n=1 Tax=Leptospira licerasiae TaxID=447106 RepID=UPI00301A01D7